MPFEANPLYAQEMLGPLWPEMTRRYVYRVAAERLRGYMN